MKVWILVGTAMAVAAMLPMTPVVADHEQDYLSLQGGTFDPWGDDSAAMGALEWCSAFGDWIVGPMAGGLVTTDGGLYGYAGVWLDLDLGDHVVLRPSLAAGAYDEGDGPDLGGPLEFRSAIELARRFDGDAQLGLVFAHLSNARIYDENPGAETLTLSYSVPLGALF